MEIIYTTSNSGCYYHKILTKLTLKSWLDNVLRRNMVKLVTNIIHIRDFNNCEVFLG